jgi:type I restriction enzyme S subunit
MSFPKYEIYKDSGVEWLGEVPEHWKLIRLRHLILDGAQGIKIGPFGSQLSSEILVDFGYKVYGQENIISQDFSRGHRFITTEKFEEMAVYRISSGDLLITMMGTAGRCKTVPENIPEGIMDSHLLRMRFRELVLSKFIEVLIDSSSYIEYQVRLNGKGSIMHGLNSSIVKELIMLIPTIEEQSSILEFINHETARIDALIAEQQRLIELLKEKRQAVISHAVTKGLDPTAPMKDSGVEWLGEVPAHWDVCHSKYLLDSVTSGSRGWAEFYSDDGYLFVRIANLTRDSIDPKLDSKQFVSPPIGSEGERSKIQIDDILISITADLGSVCVANTDIANGYVSQHVALVRPCKKKVFGRWLAYFVLSTACKEQLLGAGYGGTKIQLSLEDIKSFLISIPSHQEQIHIANFLDIEVSKFESLISEAVSGISFLQERRSALISAAVTGKIDVRNWQPPANTQPEPTPTIAHG